MVDNKEDEDAGAAAAEAVSPDPDMEDSTEEEETAEESSSEEDSSSSDEDHMANVQRPEETLLQGRSRRKTAGTRMAALLNDEEDEEFYKTTYGDEVFRDSNSDFEVSEEESWDELDTDFDDDEVEQETQVVEPTEELKKKRKVYTDPLKNLHKRRKVAPAGSKAPARGKATKSTPRPRSTRSAIQDSADIRKSSRKGTVTKTKDFEGRAKDRDEHSRRKSITRKPRVPEKKMTQAERLREAVKTEHLNALSLLRFRQKEAKAKKTVLRKTTFKGPVIRYHTRTNIAEDGTKEAQNFLAFTETSNFLRAYFPGAAQLSLRQGTFRRRKQTAKLTDRSEKEPGAAPIPPGLSGYLSTSPVKKPKHIGKVEAQTIGTAAAVLATEIC